jgi:hypothetical protein
MGCVAGCVCNNPGAMYRLDPPTRASKGFTLRQTRRKWMVNISAWVVDRASTLCDLLKAEELLHAMRRSRVHVHMAEEYRALRDEDPEATVVAFFRATVKALEFIVNRLGKVSSGSCRKPELEMERIREKASEMAEIVRDLFQRVYIENRI